MKICICYVFPNLNPGLYEPMARRFVRSYQEHPPGETPHDIVVVSNGSLIGPRQRTVFDPLPVQFTDHNNYGKDIGAFMSVAIGNQSDLLVCFGSHIYFHRAGWLDRMVDAYLDIGPGLYGCWGFFEPSPHIRTTAFWLPPELLSAYPWPIDNSHRYNFEHGPKQSILQWTLHNGLPVTMVGWNRSYIYPEFTHLSEADSLMWDQHIDRNRPPPRGRR